MEQTWIPTLQVGCEVADDDDDDGAAAAAAAAAAAEAAEMLLFWLTHSCYLPGGIPVCVCMCV